MEGGFVSLVLGERRLLSTCWTPEARRAHRTVGFCREGVAHTGLGADGNLETPDVL